MDGYDRLSVRVAAERLGVTQDAIRQRIRRGTLPSEQDDKGRYTVYVPEEELQDASARVADTSSESLAKALLDRYESENEFLRRELERKDTIIMSLTQRIPELEPAPEQRESPEMPSENVGNGTPPPDTTERRSWWRRVFLGE